MHGKNFLLLALSFINLLMMHQPLVHPIYLLDRCLSPTASLTTLPPAQSSACRLAPAQRPAHQCRHLFQASHRESSASRRSFSRRARRSGAYSSHLTPRSARLRGRSYRERRYRSLAPCSAQSQFTADMEAVHRSNLLAFFEIGRPRLGPTVRGVAVGHG